MNNQYKGMTVNERLYAGGLMEVFDKAVKDKDIEKVTDILKNIEIADESVIKLTLKELGLISRTQ